MAELRAAFERDPTGFASDELTRTILERLNQEVAALYSADNVEGGDTGRQDVREDDDDAPAPSRINSKVSVAMPKGPRPYDLWRATHELNDAVRERKIMTGSEWNNLVSRLNESSKQRKVFLLRAQHQQIADELSGFSFTPAISEKSRELAAHNKSLPERVAALMRKKKSKLDKIRHEKAQSELAEATFKPKTNVSTRPPTATSGVDEAGGRGVGQLMQYERDKLVRASQRRQLLKEIEDRELTFTPVINKNSSRIVDRITRERSEKERQAALGFSPAPAAFSPPTAARGQKAALNAALSGELDPRAMRALGRSFLPGHEEETFQPRINPRSAALQRGDSSRIYDRLFDMAASKKPVDALGATDSGESSAGQRDASGYPVDEAGEPAPGHPHYFNLVAWESSAQMDLVLRRLLRSDVQ